MSAPPDKPLAEALALLTSGEPTAAASVCRQVLAHNAHLPDALRLLGVALARLGRLPEAEDSLRLAVAADERNPAAHCNLGALLRERGRLDPALHHLKQALRLDPAMIDARLNLGAVQHDRGRYEEALRCYRTVLASRPDHPAALLNLATVLKDLGQIDAALPLFRQVLARQPDYGEAHWNLATALLVAGRLEEGWPEFEWRWRRAGLVPPRFDRPRWTGAPLDGRTILLHAEQGRGDTLQFVRYAPLVAAKGGRVILRCQPELVSLLARADGVSQVIAHEQPLPAFDCHLPLLSLPAIFATTLATIPAAGPDSAPYLRPDPARVARWRARLDQRLADAPPGGPPGLPRPFRIGLVWAGTPTHRNDHNRSLPPAALAPLLTRTDVAWLALQVGPRASELEASELGAGNVITLGPELGDFDDTAAVLTLLDRVVTVDTATAHLAGALGVPALVLLPFAPDWRWLLGRADSPWYPSLTLCRQHKPGDWEGVIAKIM